jgi:hypothetical protein
MGLFACFAFERNVGVPPRAKMAAESRRKAVVSFCRPDIFMIRTEAVAEIPLRFASLNTSPNTSHEI